MEDILTSARAQADEAELYEVTFSSVPVSFEANRLKMLKSSQVRGAALRVVKNGRVGLASNTDLRNPSALVENALAVAEFGAEARFVFPERNDWPTIEVHDIAVENVATEEMVRLGEQMIAGIRRYNPEIICSAGVSKSVHGLHISNTRGGEAHYKKTVMSLSVAGTLTRGTDILTIYEGDASCRVIPDGAHLVDKVVERFQQAEQMAEIRTCTCPVICTPRAVADILMAPLHLALNGKVVLQGASPLGEKIGQQILDERFSLWDDGTLPYRPASSICDDEGIATRRTPLIENGFLRAFLYDLQTAGLAGKETTGNGFRSLGSLPSPSPTSWVLSEGEMSIEEMIADVKEGLLIDQIMGAWAGNVLSGDFSGNVHLGFKIQNGRLVGRVKDTLVTGNALDLLRNHVVAFGSVGEWVNGSLKAPAVYLSSLSVSSKV